MIAINMTMFESVGRALIRARETARLRSQMEAARAAGVGQPQLSGWENGTKEVRLSNLGKILEAWGMSASEFGQIVDELNGAAEGSWPGLGRPSAGQDDGKGLGDGRQTAEDPAAQTELAAVIGELQREVGSLREERDGLKRCLEEVFSTVLAENRRGSLEHSTASALLSAFLTRGRSQSSQLIAEELETALDEEP